MSYIPNSYRNYNLYDRLYRKNVIDFPLNDWSMTRRIPAKRLSLSAPMYYVEGGPVGWWISLAETDKLFSFSLRFNNSKTKMRHHLGGITFLCPKNETRPMEFFPDVLFFLED